MLRFQIKHLLTCVVMGKPDDGLQPIPQGVFLFRVDHWPALFGHEQILDRSTRHC